MNVLYLNGQWQVCNAHLYSYVAVSIKGKVNGTVFDERSLIFPLGEGSEHNIPEGLETALEKFKKGEKSVIKLSPKVDQ